MGVKREFVVCFQDKRNHACFCAAGNEEVGDWDFRHKSKCWPWIEFMEHEDGRQRTWAVGR